MSLHYHADLGQLQYLDHLLLSYDETILKQKKIVSNSPYTDRNALLSALRLLKEVLNNRERQRIPVVVEEEQVQEDPGDLPPRLPLGKPHAELQYALC